MTVNDKTPPLTLEQERAQHAWKKAQEGVISKGSAYINLAKGLPALIMNSGLMQTMAFLEEKGKEHALLGKQLRAWLHERYKIPEEFPAFMEHLLEADPRTFQDINREAMAWLKWLRQLAAAQD